MYSDQKQANYGSATLGGYEQQKWQAHIQMEQQAQMACAPLMDRGQLEVAIDQNNGALNDLEEALMRLRGRLSSVLQPDHPKPCGVSEPQSRPPCSPAVAYLQGQRERIGSLMAAVNDIHARLDT